MPMITIELSPGRSHEQKREFMEKTTQLASEILKCPIESIDVVFKEIPSYDWAHAGKFYAPAPQKD